MPRRLIATLAMTVFALLAVSASAYALGVNVQAPGTGVSVQPGGVSVTAPGTQVIVGPGGTSVTVDPNQALGALPGGTGTSQPTAPAPAGESQSGNPVSSGSPSGSSASQDQPPAARTPPSQAQPGSPVGNGSRPAVRASSAQASPQRDAAAPSAARSVASPAPRDARTPMAGSAAPAAEPAPKTSVVERIVDRIPAELLAALAAMSLLAAAMSFVWLRERSNVRDARRQAQVDPLTGIPNRLAFQERLAHEWKRARRYERPLGVLMLDLDGLKRVNDTKGHDAGDEMIRTAAELIASDIRQSDLAARLAGDEFVVLCPETHCDGLQRLADKLEHQMQFSGVDVSIGWAELTTTDVRPEDMVTRADESMYRRKHSRRNAARGAIAPASLAIAG